MRLPKIRSLSEFEALFEATAGAALLPRTRYEALFDPKSCSFYTALPGMSLEHRL
jgi:hypothetical protein